MDLSGIGLRPGCLLKAPLLMGNDLRNMSASTLGIYGAEEVIEVDQTWGKQASIPWPNILQRSEIASWFGGAFSLSENLVAA